MICRQCKTLLNENNCPASFLKRQFAICRSCNQENENKRYSFQRQEIIKKLGNCQCCNVKDYKYLSIDHIHGNGHQESLKLRGKSYIRKLYHMDEFSLKSKYQSLCYNCNYAKGFYKKCPHKFSGKIELPNSYNRNINRIKNKLEMIKAYGGFCKCGENQALFLVLDHINNNGYLEKSTSIDFYQYLKSLGYPGKDTQLQLLCHNCNAVKEYQSNRLHKVEIISNTPEIYIKQKYTISDEENAELYKEARLIYSQLMFHRL